MTSARRGRVPAANAEGMTELLAAMQALADELAAVRVALAGAVEGMACNAPTPVMLDTYQAAEALKLAPSTVREMAIRGELPARKLGKAWRYPAAELAAWAAQGAA
jgi:excisionase family DNA binding protein